MNIQARIDAKQATWTVVLVALGLLSGTAQAIYSDSIFSSDYYYPTVWWAVPSSDIARLANNALTLRTDTADPRAFAQDVILGLARGQRPQVSAGHLW